LAKISFDYQINGFFVPLLSTAFSIQLFLICKGC